MLGVEGSNPFTRSIPLAPSRLPPPAVPLDVEVDGDVDVGLSHCDRPPAWTLRGGRAIMPAARD